ncbi:MAG TPA: glycosyltransferase family 2 protein [Candidatus Fimenecus excrementigallinarum]|uniref:Glycosyltransferase family 2 protein n=1 Tax=Candidatus Fimenecus excrementigallinarum TaxID=2840816 RepID=A0A9D1LE61_9FIRM|nr:glycosyltransferase family 2 protein [Candidatus Fimenecus excrementigallinarum]
MKLSLVVPCYNEAENVAEFQKTVIQTFENEAYEYEIVFVDDGSSDATYCNLKKIYEAQKCPVKVVVFSRNFGKESAIYAGIQNASGDYISLIDADLQQRPELVRDMVKILDENPDYDVVAAYQEHRNESKVLSACKKVFYSVINRLTNTELKADASDFRTFRRNVAESILHLGEFHRFSKGLFSWVGYNTCFIPYTACAREKGVSKWSFFKLVNYAIEGIVGFSTKPLRIATLFGTLTGVAALVYLLVVFIQKLVIGIDVPGYATLIILILFLGAAQLFCIGIIGEYVGRIFEQSKERPIYIAKEILDYRK